MRSMPRYCKVFDVPDGQGEPDVHHHRQADDLGAGLESAEQVAFGHSVPLSYGPIGSSVVPDKTISTHNDSSLRLKAASASAADFCILRPARANSSRGRVNFTPKPPFQPKFPEFVTYPPPTFIEELIKRPSLRQFVRSGSWGAWLLFDEVLGGVNREDDNRLAENFNGVRAAFNRGPGWEIISGEIRTNDGHVTLDTVEAPGLESGRLTFDARTELLLGGSVEGRGSAALLLRPLTQSADLRV